MMSIIEQLMSEGVQTRDIAFLSFSKKAVREAIDRATKKFSLDAEDDLPLFRTLHSLSYRIGKPGTPMKGEHWRKFGYQFQWEVNSDGEDVEDGDNLTANYSEHDDEKVKQAHTWARNTMKSLDEACRVFQVPRNRLTEFDLNIRRFKAEHGLADYPAGMERMRDGNLSIPCRVLIVDEAQDLSPLQQAALAPTIAKVERVIVAGDDDQAIYEFQGADQRWLIGLTQTDGWSTVVLSQSYRLRQRPWAYAMRFCGALRQRAQKDYYPIDDGFGGRIEEDATPEDAIERLIETATAPQFRGRTAAWLCRRRKSLEDVQDELLESAAPFVSQVGKLDTNPMRRDKSGVCITRRMVQALTDLRDGKKVEVSDLVEVCEEGIRLRRSSKADPECEFGHVKLKSQLEGIKSRGKSKVSRHELMGGDCDASKLLAGVDKRGPVAVLDKLPHVIRDYLLRLWDVHGCIPEPTVQLSTIHQAKGGEWDVVVVDLSTSAWLEERIREQDAAESEKRIAYVAATRAKDELWMLPMEIRQRSKGGEEEVLSFRDYLTA
jgi:hypothetical protein